MEGGTIFGLSAALYGKITVKNGVPEQGNFDTYRIVRFAEAPKIDVYIVPSGGPAWGGVGEASTPPIMAAVAVDDTEVVVFQGGETLPWSVGEVTR